ncbi:MAG: RNA polymerase sigma factor SigZ [Chloroflexi bacterium]|nr:RNA polymerase sigma factor SigZ [Chloroflexota bacterium]
MDTEHLWREFSKDLRAFITRRVPNEQDADDILQEAFIKIHKHLNSLENEDRLAAWIYQITRRTIADYYRRAKPGVPLPPDWEEAAASSGEGESEVEAEVASWLKPMIAELPPKYREALRLTEFEGLNQKQLAAKLGLSHSGAKSRVQRGRALLRKQVLDCCHLEFDRRGGIIDYQPLHRDD